MKASKSSNKRSRSPSTEKNEKESENKAETSQCTEIQNEKKIKVDASKSHEGLSDCTKQSDVDTNKQDESKIQNKSSEPQNFGFSSYKTNPFQSCVANTSGANEGFGSTKSEGQKSSFGEIQPENPFLKLASSKPSFGFGKNKTNSPASPPELAGGENSVSKNESKSNESSPENCKSKSVFVPSVPLLEEIEPNNGEEGERCILQLRAKLFRLTKLKEKPRPSQNTDTQNQDNKEKCKESPPKPELKDEEASQKTSSTALVEWVEVGIGPARFLVPIEVKKLPVGRIVMRRETKPGGQGTKVILNAALGVHMKVARHGEKEVRVVTVTDEGTTPISYLLKVKLKSDADKLFSTIEEYLQKEEINKA